jgi:hypothetical protein
MARGAGNERLRDVLKFIRKERRGSEYFVFD